MTYYYKQRYLKSVPDLERDKYFALSFFVCFSFIVQLVNI